MDAHLILLARVLVDERRAVDRELAFLGRERNRAPDLSSRTLSGLDDRLSGLVNDLVVVGTDLDTDLHASFCVGFLLCGHNRRKKEREEGQFALPLLFKII